LPVTYDGFSTINRRLIWFQR